MKRSFFLCLFEILFVILIIWVGIAFFAPPESVQRCLASSSLSEYPPFVYNFIITIREILCNCRILILEASSRISNGSLGESQWQDLLNCVISIEDIDRRLIAIEGLVELIVYRLTSGVPAVILILLMWVVAAYDGYIMRTIAFENFSPSHPGVSLISLFLALTSVPLSLSILLIPLPSAEYIATGIALSGAPLINFAIRHFHQFN